ncbi:MAG: UTP--glucose-1-phosphate uridylyltransferase, partial [Candidatus Cloacimonetes bacterium]|nr:UTP--glucose-1-phosphate uridylyltransferase [Candidatus Cloacimonadota bacterium]
EKLCKGETGKLSREEIQPPTEQNLIRYDDIRHERSMEMLKRTVIIKLNGGLGTSMGLSKAKSLLPVKGNMTFLDIIARQILVLRAQSGYDAALLLMNSFSTQNDTENYLKRYPDLERQPVPICFIQNKFPRIRQSDLMPLDNPDASKLWNPPGHGDIYTAISSSGILDKLVEQGYRYAFVSNSDNLGAVVDTSIPVYMEQNNVQFVMEVCERTPADSKGGHLCEDRQGHLMLREVAQCPSGEELEFQDINYYKYFNTNNLWIDLKALQWTLIAHDGIMQLPLIINPKSIDGSPVYQLETAMGAAISVFVRSKALVVPRQRFAPVKKTTDLVALWSDAYEMNDQYQIVLRRNLSQAPVVTLDDRFYQSIDQLTRRFSEGVPSLISCSSLQITGDVSFGEDVICEGDVVINASEPLHLKHRLISGKLVT